MAGLPAAPPPSPLPAPAAPVARAPVVRPAPVARFLRASAVGFRLDRGALRLGRGVARMGKAVAHVSVGATVTAGASDGASTVKMDRRARCSASKGPTPSKNAGPPVAARTVRGSRWGAGSERGGEFMCWGKKTLLPSLRFHLQRCQGRAQTHMLGMAVDPLPGEVYGTGLCALYGASGERHVVPSTKAATSKSVGKTKMEGQGKTNACFDHAEPDNAQIALWAMN